jgi:glycosyltransferase involved in cell wall biosynthesis
VTERKLRVRIVSLLPPSVLCGGMELQTIKTVRALREIGLEASFANYDDPNDDFDVVHLFGSSPNYYELVREIAGRWPIVVSAVCGGSSASWMRPVVFGLVSTFARAAHVQTTFERTAYVHATASKVLCLTQSEADFVRVTYGTRPENIAIVTNGVDDAYFTASPEAFVDRYGIDDFVLFTGNIVRRKNPLLLAQALEQLRHPGVFIGSLVATEAAYGAAFRTVVERNRNLLWIPGLDSTDPLLVSAYAAARIFCLPSTAETQSLSALEAMAAGTAPVLADRLYARQDPFGSAPKCDPSSLDSLRTSLARAMGVSVKRRLPDGYRWREIAARLASTYVALLGSSK